MLRGIPREEHGRKSRLGQWCSQLYEQRIWRYSSYVWKSMHVPLICSALFWWHLSNTRSTRASVQFCLKACSEWGEGCDTIIFFYVSFHQSSTIINLHCTGLTHWDKTSGPSTVDAIIVVFIFTIYRHRLGFVQWVFSEGGVEVNCEPLSGGYTPHTIVIFFVLCGVHCLDSHRF